MGTIQHNVYKKIVNIIRIAIVKAKFKRYYILQKNNNNGTNYKCNLYRLGFNKKWIFLGYAKIKLYTLLQHDLAIYKMIKHIV